LLHRSQHAVAVEHGRRLAFRPVVRAADIAARRSTRDETDAGQAGRTERATQEVALGLGSAIAATGPLIESAKTERRTRQLSEP
jgi:hypothetical protein